MANAAGDDTEVVAAKVAPPPPAYYLVCAICRRSRRDQGRIRGSPLNALRQLSSFVCEDVAALREHRPSRAEVLAALCTNRGLQALVLHRVSRILWQKHILIVPDFL